MRLPDNSVGISDINAWRDCPERMAFGMERWTEAGEPPEAQGPNTAYGSAVHYAIDKTANELMTDLEAIEAAFAEFGKYLDPSDLEMMEADLRTYRERDREHHGRLIAAEGEYKVPLFEHEGEMIYFRFKIDRLYQNLADPGVFEHIDYKSSKWRKTQDEVDEDTQMWAYNWGIHEVFPECRDLLQTYDQLHFGEVTTHKGEAQRRQIKAWIINQVKAILADDDLAPTFNEWCPWCPLLPSCKEPLRTSEFAVARLAALAPEAQAGGKLDLDPDLFEVYISEYERAMVARKALEKFEEAVKDTIRDLPQANRVYHGYDLSMRSQDTWSPSALIELHEMLGDELFRLVKLPKTRVLSYFKGDDRKADVLALASKEGQKPALKRLAD
jgi:hypothetical protein